MSNVTYELSGGIATIRIDDGKRNALSPQVFGEIYAALDRAEADKAAVVLTGRPEVFSAGFDLNVMRRGDASTLKMLGMGYWLTARVLSFPYPVVAACDGHVLAMGVFLLLSCDYTIGTRGDFKISANEVAIGIPVPRVASMMLEHRLNPADYQRAVALAHFFNVEEAQRAGFFNEVVDSGQALARAKDKAAELLKLHMPSHLRSKLRIRRRLIRRIRCNVPLDLLEALWLGVRGAMGKKK